MYTVPRFGQSLKYFRRFGAPTLLAATTQALALVQLVLLLLGTGPGPASDAYFYIIAWIQVPWQMILLGVIYPMWIRASHVPLERVWLTAVPILSGLASVVAAWIFAQIAQPYPELAIHCALLASIGVASGALWAIVLRLAANGESNWFAAVTLPANLASCIALLFAHGLSLTDRVTCLLAGQLVGTLSYLLVVGVRTAKRPRIERVSTAARSRETQGWFLAQSATAYGAMLAIQTQAATLPANGLSSLGVISRIVAGAGAVVTNAILPRIVHSESASSAPVFRYVRFVNLVAWSALPIAIALVIFLQLQSSLLGYVIFMLPWIVATNLNASMKRVAARFLSPRVAILSVASAIVLPVMLWVASAQGSQSLSIVLLTFILMDLVPGVGLAIIQRRLLLALSATSYFALATLVALTLLSPTPTF